MARKKLPFRTGRYLKGFGEDKKFSMDFLSEVLEIAESYLRSEANIANDFSILSAGICLKKSALNYFMI